MTHLTTSKQKELDEIRASHARWAGGLGLGTVFIPLADVLVIGANWTSLLIKIADASGHPVDKRFAKKCAAAMVKGGLLYLAGSRLGTWVLSMTGVGAPGAMVANAGLNYGYTWLLGGFLIKQFNQPEVDLDGLASSAVAYLLSFGLSEVAGLKDMHDVASTATDVASAATDMASTAPDVYASTNAVAEAHTGPAIMADIHLAPPSVADVHAATAPALSPSFAALAPAAPVSPTIWGGVELHPAWGTIQLAAPDFEQAVSNLCAAYHHPSLVTHEASGFVENALNSPGLLRASFDDGILLSRPFMESVLYTPQFGESAYHFVINHEVGHSLLGRMNETLGFVPTLQRQGLELVWNNELWSDWFGGHALARQGLSPDGAMNFLRTTSTPSINPHDPGVDRRISALKAGYTYARSQMNSMVGNRAMSLQDMWLSWQEISAAFSPV